MTHTRRSTMAVSMLAVVATACSSGPPPPGDDVFVTSEVLEAPRTDVDIFVSDSLDVTSCTLTEPGVVVVEGTFDVGPTGVLDDGPVDAEIVVDVLLGDTVVGATMAGSIEAPGTWRVTYPMEEVHGEDATRVVEGRIGDGTEFAATCRAQLRTPTVRFDPGETQPLTAADGVTPRSMGG